jgi:starch-binding outer membrane protein, SusD/RagB family
MKNIIKTLLVSVALFGTSCTDLEILPESSNELLEIDVFKDPNAYKQYLAKLYAGLAVTGQKGPAGDGDLANIDEGFSSYLRVYWKAQELTTDEAVIAWSDKTLSDFHEHDWTTNDGFLAAMYGRIFFQVVQCNEFLRQAADAKLTARVADAAKQTEIRAMRSDARFLRALSYWHALDMFGNVPFVTEANDLGGINPNQTNRIDLFNYLERELKEIENDLPAPKQGEYARADKAAAWTLLAKLYLNAEIYIGTAKYTECITYCNKIISANVYDLSPNFRHLFMADNNSSQAAKEIIFPIAFDDKTRTWGGMTFLTHAAVGGTMTPSDYGLGGGWNGLRVTASLVDLYADDSAKIDKRSTFYRNGQTKEINAISNFKDGYALPKFVNKTSTGANGKNLTHPDTDFPMFRLADVHLMYAEAVLRGGSGGDRATSLTRVNEVRQRAYKDSTDLTGARGKIIDAQLTLNFILDERARELCWEGHRRTDLIRFKKFTENGIWPWKGGVKAGKTTETFRNLFPIPSSDMIANPKLKQNTGY